VISPAVVDVANDQGIHDFREKMFANVPHRDHHINQIFTFGGNDQELMAMGGVSYKFHDGTEHERQWAARYSIVSGDDGHLKFRLVQILIVS
jgi:hypothetical protein